jgi:hypothetical protein
MADAEIGEEAGKGAATISREQREREGSGGREGGGRRRGEVLDMVEVSAHLEPLRGVAVDVVAIEEHGEHGRHAGAVLGQPVRLEDAQRRRHARVHGLLVLAAQDGELGEVRQRQSVERGLLAVQVQRDGAVVLRAPDQRHQRHGRRAQLLHVLPHAGCRLPLPGAQPIGSRLSPAKCDHNDTNMKQKQRPAGAKRTVKPIRCDAMGCDVRGIE